MRVRHKTKDLGEGLVVDSRCKVVHWREPRQPGEDRFRVRWDKDAENGVTWGPKVRWYKLKDLYILSPSE